MNPLNVKSTDNSKLIVASEVNRKYYTPTTIVNNLHK